ncbi:hypothetical protein MRX96_041528 [Rhipicephalus microplus]
MMDRGLWNWPVSRQKLVRTDSGSNSDGRLCSGCTSGGGGARMGLLLSSGASYLGSRMSNLGSGATGIGSTRLKGPAARLARLVLSCNGNGTPSRPCKAPFIKALSSEQQYREALAIGIFVHRLTYIVPQAAGPSTYGTKKRQPRVCKVRTFGFGWEGDNMQHIFNTNA